MLVSSVVCNSVSDDVCRDVVAADSESEVTVSDTLEEDDVVDGSDVEEASSVEVTDSASSDVVVSSPDETLPTSVDSVEVELLERVTEVSVSVD